MFENTILFRDIFPTYDDFLSFYNTIAIDPNSPITGSFISWCYSVLYREYMNSNIQYDTIDEFKADFANILEEHVEQYFIQKGWIDQMLKLTPAEIEIIGKRLTNAANNPNTLPDDPTVPLDFVSAQAYEQTTDNRLKAYLEAINKLPSTRQKEFVSRFRSLFKPYYQTGYYYYYDEG